MEKPDRLSVQERAEWDQAWAIVNERLDYLIDLYCTPPLGDVAVPQEVVLAGMATALTRDLQHRTACELLVCAIHRIDALQHTTEKG